MGRRGEVYSTRFTSGERTYFFNVHENIKNEYSLSLIESKQTETEGRFLRQSVLVYEEDFDNFLNELQKAVDVMKIKMSENKKNSSKPKVILKRKNENITNVVNKEMKDEKEIN